MKKLAPLAIIALLSFASCKKDYKCTCTFTVAGSSAQTVTTDLGKQKKSDAKSACSAKSVSTNGVDYSCALD